MQVNRNNHLRVVKENQMHTVIKNGRDAKKIAHLETVILELLVTNKNSILHEFAKKVGVTPKQILEHNKCDRMCDIRHLYCYLRCKMDNESYTTVGKEINRSHTAVSNGVKRIQEMLNINYKPVVDLWNKVKHISEKSKYRVM